MAPLLHALENTGTVPDCSAHCLVSPGLADTSLLSCACSQRKGRWDEVKLYQMGYKQV